MSVLIPQRQNRVVRGMLELFSPLKGYHRIKPICMDNFIFWLHYKATFIILIGLSLMVSTKQFFGEPISCIVDDIPEKVMNTYCWVHSKYSLPSRHTSTMGNDVVQPEVAGHVENEGEVKYYKYYQWVSLLLFLQAILFYVPHGLWKRWEGGRIKELVQDLLSPTDNEELKRNRIKLLLDYLSSNLHTQNFYAISFFICEVLNLFNVLAQTYLMDYFLDGEFSTYGLDVLSFTVLNPEQREDPMFKLFPKLTKCSFYKYGPSGSIQKLEGLCILPLNNLNEKIYVFLWFWFIILTMLSVLAVVFRVAVICRPQLRLYLLRTRSILSPRNHIENITKHCYLGDWFILYQLSKNMDPVLYTDLIIDLNKKFQDKQ